MGGGPYGPVNLLPDSEMEEIVIQEFFSEAGADNAHIDWRVNCYNLCQASKQQYQGTGEPSEPAQRALRAR